MAQKFTLQRLTEFQTLYAKHYGKEITLEQAEIKLTGLVRLIMVCTGAAGMTAGGKGRDSNPAPVTNDKNVNG